MYISPVSNINSTIKYKKQQVNSIKATQTNTNFKSAEYAKAFTKYFEGPVVPNEQIYRDLMTKAQKIRGALVEDIAKVFFKPEDYNRALEGSRKKAPVYNAINESCYRKPAYLVKSGNAILVTVVNMGYQGNFLDLLFSNVHNDLRICFHDANDYKKVICLGQDNNGKDRCIISRDGISTIISAETLSKI